MHAFHTHVYPYIIRWMKPKIELLNRICTLCDDKDIQNEYHMVLKCVHIHTLGIHINNKYCYVRHSTYIFQQLMNRRKKGNIVD